MPPPWVKWFAWHPVKISYPTAGGWVWRRQILRRCWDTGQYRSYDYRLIDE